MNLYISCLTLNAKHCRASSEIERPYELHRTLCNAWDDRGAARILFRADAKTDVVNVIVQSHTAPDWSRLNVSRDYLMQSAGPKRVSLNSLDLGLKLAFRLRCRPSKRVFSGPGKVGPRRSITDKDEILDWLRRKADECGFDVDSVAFDRLYWNDTKGGKENRVGSVQFDGLLKVTDPENLRQAIANGIGTQKAYGFGLLSVARV